MFQYVWYNVILILQYKTKHFLKYRHSTAQNMFGKLCCILYRLDSLKLINSLIALHFAQLNRFSENGFGKLFAWNAVYFITSSASQRVLSPHCLATRLDNWFSTDHRMALKNSKTGLPIIEAAAAAATIPASVPKYSCTASPRTRIALRFMIAQRSRICFCFN